MIGLHAEDEHIVGSVGTSDFVVKLVSMKKLAGKVSKERSFTSSLKFSIIYWQSTRGLGAVTVVAMIDNSSAEVTEVRLGPQSWITIIFN